MSQSIAERRVALCLDRAGHVVTAISVVHLIRCRRMGFAPFCSQICSQFGGLNSQAAAAQFTADVCRSE
jgi:hypothetical protein